ncbi:MAG: HAD family hydrolase [Dehalococcoidia bacterium]|nr:HAD family hydrolase [Dehalococcoidia bacterium]
MANRAVFIDRDGTMAKDVHYCRHPEDFELLPDTAKAIRLLNQHSFKVIVITNQSGIARGYFTEETLAEIHEKMRGELAKERAWVDAIYYCPHHPDDNCQCRKPKPKLALQAAKNHDIELEGCFVVGDLQMDIDLGKAIGCRTILIGTLPPMDDESPKPDIVVSDLLGAVETILRGQL